MAAIGYRTPSPWRPAGTATLLLLGLLTLFTLLTSWAQLAVPTLSGHVVDTTATLPAAGMQQLDSRLAAFEQRRGTQIVVLLVPTTQPEDIASYANRVANSWKIGRREVGDGLLLIVALNDRKVRIEVAKTLEGAIPDLAAKRIIDAAITPAFKQGDYLAGLNAGVDQLMARVTGEELPLPAAAPAHAGGGDGFQWIDLLVFLFFVMPVVGAVARRMLGSLAGSVATGALIGVIAFVVTASLLVAVPAALVGAVLTLLFGASRSGSASGWHGGGHGGWAGGGRGGGGGGGGGFGGGGFGGGMHSGGGGDFGGGGASGDW
jgi:uncharacterized protein